MSVQSEESPKATVHTREAHEGEAQQTSRHEHDGCALHAFGNLCQRHLLANAGKDNQCQPKANGCGESVDDALQQREILLDDQDGYAKYGTVGGDERQEDAERLIERWRHLLENNLNHLHKSGNDEDKSNGL